MVNRTIFFLTLLLFVSCSTNKSMSDNDSEAENDDSGKQIYSDESEDIMSDDESEDIINDDEFEDSTPDSEITTENNDNEYEILCNKISRHSENSNTFYETNPTLADPDLKDDLPRSTAEEMKIEKKMITDGIKYLEQFPQMFSMIVSRKGNVVTEHYFNGSSKTASNNIHSASKSIISLLTGIAIEQKIIPGVDEPIHKYFEEYSDIFEESEQKKKITIKHLLEMSHGFDWIENITEVDDIQKNEDWIRAIIERKQIENPGSKFNYSTGATHLLSAIITKASGVSTCEFAHKNLFKHLGITVERWGKDPSGNFSGGYNFYISPLELHKFGVFISKQGIWNEKRIIGKEWIETSLTRHIDAHVPELDYGFNWWVRKISGIETKIAWGYGGQFLFIFPEIDVIVSITTNTRDFREEELREDFYFFIKDYILPAVSQ